MTSDRDKRPRLPHSADTLLRRPARMPKALALPLKIAPGTGTLLLTKMEAKGAVREGAKRASFRAFAV